MHGAGIVVGSVITSTVAIPADISIPSAHVARTDDDREAYEFSHTLYLDRQVDRDAAQMIVEAAEAGLIQLSCATDLLMQLSRQASKGYLSG